jgi:hypothetical protein
MADPVGLELQLRCMSGTAWTIPFTAANITVQHVRQTDLSGPSAHCGSSGCSGSGVW